MPVVVNEFEVVNEPVSPGPPAPAQAAAPTRQPPDLEIALAALRARHSRARAY